jgi:hypothetical protein
MIILTAPQRDFLDRYYTEYMNLQAGPTVAFASQHGFGYEHLLALFDSYRQSWGGSLEVWNAPFPPLPPPPDPLVFPWASIQALEEQLKAEGLTISSIKNLNFITDNCDDHTIISRDSTSEVKG